MKRSAKSLDTGDVKAENYVDAEDNKKRKKVRFEKSLDNKSTGKNEKVEIVICENNKNIFSCR